MRNVVDRLNAFLASFVGVFVFICLGLWMPASVSALTVIPDGFDVEFVTKGLTRPTAMAFAPDGRVFVAEKSGSVRIFSADFVLDDTPFITLTDVNDFGDRGLIGIALDPDFANNGYVYLAYTYENNPGDYEGEKTARVVRFTESGGQAVSGSATVILGNVGGDSNAPSCADYPSGSDCVASDSSSHSIGGMRFGPDGKLYVSTGDGAQFVIADEHAFRAQDLDHLSGKILRINPDGSGPSDNPFYTGNSTDNESKVYAYGFRNPYRFNFDPVTGLLVVADVGWGEKEEFDVVDAGGNYGWPCREGTLQTSGYDTFPGCPLSGPVEEPDYEYDHVDVGDQKIGVITGGAFAASSAYPASFRGSYTFADAAFGWIKSASFNGDTLQSVDDFAEDVPFPVEFVTGNDGLIYLLTHYSGEIRRIVYDGDVNAIDAVINADTTVGVAPLTVQFDGTDSDGAQSYAWNFDDGSSAVSVDPNTFGYSPNCIPGSDADGDGWGWDGVGGCRVEFIGAGGGTSALARPSFTFASPGTYDVSLTVSGNGASDTVVQTITVLEASANNVEPLIVDTALSAAPYFFGSPVTVIAGIGNALGNDAFRVLFEVFDADGIHLSAFDYISDDVTVAPGTELTVSRDFLLPIAGYSVQVSAISSDLGTVYDVGGAQSFRVITRVPGSDDTDDSASDDDDVTTPPADLFGYSPSCIPDSDTDGDGWGWDGTSGCLVAFIDNPPVAADDTDVGNVDDDISDPAGPSDDEDLPIDLFGYSPNCIPGSDADGDGWGWDGVGGCRVEFIDNPPVAGGSDDTSDVDDSTSDDSSNEDVSNFVDDNVDESGDADINTPSVSSGVKYTLYDNALAAGWQNWSWNTNGPLLGASIDLVINQNGSGLYLHADTPQSVTEDDVVSFSIQTDVSASALTVSLYDETDSRIARVDLDEYIATDGTVQSVAIPVSVFASGTFDIAGFVLQGSSAALGQQIIIDDVLILE